MTVRKIGGGFLVRPRHTGRRVCVDRHRLDGVPAS